MKHPDDLIRSGNSSDSEVQSLTKYREWPPFQFPTNGDPESDDQETLGVRDYWLMVRGRLLLIIAITLLVTTLALIYVGRLPDVYQAEARIQVDMENNPALGAGKNGAVIINNPGEDPSYFNTQLLLLKSPAFLRRVVKTLDLDQGPNGFSLDSSRRSTTWGNILEMAHLGRNRTRSEDVPSKPLRANSIAPVSTDGDMGEAQRLEPYVVAIKTGLDVRLTETSRLININFNHSDPNTAAKVVNVIADTFVQANWERRSISTSSASEFLQKRIAELQGKIATNERRLLEYAKQHEIFPLDSGRDIVADRLTALDKGLLEAENTRKAAESQYQAALAPGAAAAIVEGNNNSQIATINAKLADLRQKREVMLLEAGENWPEVKELNKQITNLEDQLKETREHAVGVVLTNLETTYRQALAREQSLRKAFQDQHSVAMSQDSAAIDYRMIQQETTTYRGLLDSLLQRSKENEIVLAATPNNVHVTDYATLPVAPTGPQRFRIVALAFAVSFAFGVGLVILLGSLEDGVPIDSVQRVERLFGLPALAVIPVVSGQGLGSILRLKNRNGNGHSRLLLSGAMRSSFVDSDPRPGNGNGHKGLLLYEKPHSPLAESYKKLRTSVLLSFSDRPPKTLLVTSSLPSEGKTTAVINTGLVMAQTGAKVLLIDGDLRRPSLHSILGIENERGLTTILSSDFSEAEALSMITQYQDSSLYVLPAGPTPDNPAELLGSERMRGLITTLHSTFSHVIIDSPPITFFTDAVLISSLVDGVLMIVRGPKSPRQVARHSVQSLDGVGAPILGVILNAVNLRTNNYAYYQNYYR